MNAHTQIDYARCDDNLRELMRESAQGAARRAKGRTVSQGTAACLMALSHGPRRADEVKDPSGLVADRSIPRFMIDLTKASPRLATRWSVPHPTRKGLFVWLYTITDEGREALAAWEAAQ